MSNYGVQQTGRCVSCLFLTTDPRHFKSHVPANRWPAEMRPVHKKRVVINGKVYNADLVDYDEFDRPFLISSGEHIAETPKPATECPLRPLGSDSEPLETKVVCECGWAVKDGTASPQNAYRLHRRQARVHRTPQVVNA